MRSLLLLVLALLVAPAGQARAAARNEPVDMKLRVWLSPGRIDELADRVLEFYEVGPESFVAAFTREDHDWLVAHGYSVDVLVRDMREEAARFDAFFHTYQQICDTWAIIAQDHPGICVLDTIGTSYNGNLMLAMKISDNPTVMEGEPRICFDFTIHGNENNGTEIAHHVLLELVNGYGSDPDITRWVNSREIWLLPMVNPDGLISRSRTNGRGVDCNRNYGYAWSGGGSGPFSEPEIQALYRLGVANPMAMWTQYHSGTERAMWPWGYTQLATMDSVVHRYEMVRYGQLAGYPYCQIARGLYPVNGGSTDWYYGATGAQGYGIEVCNGQPSPPSQIDEINAENWLAMQEMIERVGWGVGGRVLDSVSGAPLAARIELTPPDWLTYADTMGYFHKNLHAGTYSVTVRANGYATRTIPGVVVPAEGSAWLDIALAPDSVAAPTAFRVITSKLGSSNSTSAWWALGPRDGRRLTLEKGAWASFDMGENTPIINGPGIDFYVVEDDGSPGACSVYVANDWNGPWHYAGFGTGTQGYDLQVAGQSVARFVRIADDNIGTDGYHLDAIEAVVVSAPALVLQGRTVIDSPPGGNADGKLDPGETADLIVELKNVGRVGVSGLTGILRTGDSMVSIPDSTGTFGELLPDSTRRNNADRFVVSADAATPREHPARMVLHLAGTDYADSLVFTLIVGELRSVDPIPDNASPVRYWAYDDGDSGYVQAPVFDWYDITGVGTRLPITGDDQTVQFN
ncbi:MAG: M14 family zinc carboxypeptidase, partial [bacterium]